MIKMSGERMFVVLLTISAWLDVMAAVSTCPACAIRDEIREYRKNDIKNTILRKLGFEKEPNITGAANLRSNRLVRSLIHKMETESRSGMVSDQPYSYSGDDMFQPDQITIIPTKTKEADIAELNWDLLMHFTLNNWTHENKGLMESATLMLHLPPAPSSHHTQATVNVYYVARDKVTGQPVQYRAKDVTWKLREDRGGLVKIDLTNLVRKWLRNPSENLGIVIKAWSSDQVLAVPSLESALAPYLQLHFNRSYSHMRYKRAANMQCNEKEDKHVTQCCRWPLIIDFDEFGWDWVMSPSKYEANFCQGDCSLGIVAENPHTHLMQMHPNLKVAPCCSASKWGELEMMYLNGDQQLVKGKLPGMVVEKCGCS